MNKRSIFKFLIPELIQTSVILISVLEREHENGDRRSTKRKTI